MPAYDNEIRKQSEAGDLHLGLGGFLCFLGAYEGRRGKGVRPTSPRCAGASASVAATRRSACSHESAAACAPGRFFAN